MAEQQQQQAPAPIIVRRKKGGDHAHHGGAWKVAYADFVTAMMAFFLLLWLLNATTTEQKLGISNYFDPLGATRSQGGSTGVMAGKSPGEEGTEEATRVPPSVNMPMTQQPVSKGEENKSVDPKDADDEPKNYLESTAAAALEKALAEREQAEFEKAENMLRQAIENLPELKGLNEHLLVDQTPEGLRIQLVDQDRRSMFTRGSPQPLDHARRLLGLVAQAVKDLPNKLTITGHTDSTPYPGGAGYTNWELSTDRANASRKTLVELGVGGDRVASVVGKADREHLDADDPNSPRNRRISIVLLRETPIRAADPPGPVDKAGAPPRHAADDKPRHAADDKPPRELAQKPTPGTRGAQKLIPGTMGKAAPPVIEPPPAK